LGRHFTGQADYTDTHESAVEIAKSAGFDFLPLGAIINVTSDNPLLAAE
jgi:hypothetical protein